MTHSSADMLPTDTEISAMAHVLTRRYGTKAGQIALHFKAEHELIGDSARANLWGKVYLRLDCPHAPTTLS